jgi:hypothetical protein
MGPTVKYVDRKCFMLTNGQCFKHLFVWSYIPPVEDFNILLQNCYDLMTDSLLEETDKIKVKRFKKKDNGLQVEIKGEKHD